MFIPKSALLLCCFLALTLAKKKKDEGDGAIRVVVRGPLPPFIMESLSNMMMNQYLKSIPQTTDMSSRSDFRSAPFYPGTGSYSGGPYPGPPPQQYHFGPPPPLPSPPRRFAPNGYYSNYNPKRTGFNLGVGLGTLKGLILGSGSSELQHKLDTRGSYLRRGEYDYHHPGSYDVFKSLIPKFNIQDGLQLLKGLIKGSKASKGEGFQVGQRLGTLKAEVEHKTGGFKHVVKSLAGDQPYYYAKPNAPGNYYGNSY